MRSVTRNLQDRKVVQWGLAYLAGAWLVLQVLDVLADVWPVSIPLQQGLQILLVAALPLVLTLAWYHGEKGRQRVSGTELLLLALLLLIAGGVMALWHRAGSGVAAAGGAMEGDVVPGGVPGDATPAAVAGARPEQASVAVLPFTDMSPAGDQEYFGDGVAEEILHALSRVPGLRVAARTSAFSFKGSDADIRLIAERLGVTAVLEGSVRREGDRVRVTAQLIDAADGLHLWSEEYDRELAGVVAVQEEIARAIVAALRVQLAPGSGLERPWFATTSSEAYHAFLRGSFAARGTDSRAALEWFDRAVELDPGFAPARAGRAAALYMQGHFGIRPYGEMMAAARAEAARALALDDRQAAAHAIVSAIALYHDRDFAVAEREALRALELDPNDAAARHAYADLLTVRGDPEAAVRQLELGRQADPLSPLANLAVAGHIVLARRFTDALTELDAYHDVFGDHPATPTFRGCALWHLGRRDEAMAVYRAFWGRDSALARTVEAALAAGGPTAATRAWADYLAGHFATAGVAAEEIATVYARAGATAEALAWLERAAAAPSPLSLHLAASPDLDGLRGHPRFRALMRRMGIAAG